MEEKNLVNFFNTTERMYKHSFGIHPLALLFYAGLYFLGLLPSALNYAVAALVAAVTIFIIVMFFFKKTAAKYDVISGVTMLEMSLLALVAAVVSVYEKEYSVYFAIGYFLIWCAYGVFACWSIRKNVEEDKYSDENAAHQIRYKNEGIFFVDTRRFHVAIIIFVILLAGQLAVSLCGAPFCQKEGISYDLMSVLMLLLSAFAMLFWRPLMRAFFWQKYGVKSDGN